MALTKGMFIELDYTGKSNGKVFDTTVESVAKEHGLNPKATYQPSIICLGEGHLLPGLDTFLEGKEQGRYIVKLAPEDGFGKKDAKLLKLIPRQKFKEAKIEPFIGLDLNIDGSYGIVRSISGGRITVDFNHPLAGRELEYELDVKRVVEDPAEQVGAVLDVVGMHHHGVTMESPEHAVVKVHQIPPQPVSEQLNSIITKLTKVKTVSYQADAADHGAPSAASGAQQ